MFLQMSRDFEFTMSIWIIKKRVRSIVQEIRAEEFDSQHDENSVFLIIGHFSSKVFFSFPFEFDIDLELICKKVTTFEIDIELSPPDRSFSLRINMHFSSSVRRLGPKQPRINDYCATPSQHDGGSIGIPSQRVASWHYNSRFSRWSVFKNRGLLLE